MGGQRRVIEPVSHRRLKLRARAGSHQPRRDQDGDDECARREDRLGPALSTLYIPFGQTTTTLRKSASSFVRSFSSATGAWQYPAGS